MINFQIDLAAKAVAALRAVNGKRYDIGAGFEIFCKYQCRNCISFWCIMKSKKVLFFVYLFMYFCLYLQLHIPKIINISQ